MTYPYILRAIVRDFYFKNSLSIRKVATIFHISKSTIHRWIHNSSLLLKYKKRTSKLTPILNYITSFVNDNPFTTLALLSNSIKNKFNIDISISSLSKYLRHIGFSFKKALRKVCSNKDTLSKLRSKFIKKIKHISYSNIISIDETYFYSNESPLYGWSLKNSTLSTTTKNNPTKFSVIMAITKNGILDFEIHKTNINSSLFNSFIITKVLPFTKNKFLLMDNVSFHKNKILVDKVHCNNTKFLYIPPYSPEFNPIEFVFSSIKTKYRSILQFPKKIDTIESLLHSYKNTNFSNIYKHIKKIT